MVSGNGPPVIDGVGHYTGRLSWGRGWRRAAAVAVGVVEAEAAVVYRPGGVPRGGRGLAAVAHLGPVRAGDGGGDGPESPAGHHPRSGTDPLVPRNPGRRRGAGRRSEVPGRHRPRSSSGTGELSMDRRSRPFRLPGDHQRSIHGRKRLRQFGREPDAVFWSPSNLRPPAIPARRPGLVVTFGFLSAVKALTSARCSPRSPGAVPGLRWRIVGRSGRTPTCTTPPWRPPARGLIEFTGARDDLDDSALRGWLAEAAPHGRPVRRQLPPGARPSRRPGVRAADGDHAARGAGTDGAVRTGENFAWPLRSGTGPGWVPPRSPGH